MVVAHVERMCMLKISCGAIEPWLEVLEPGLEVAAFGIVEGREELTQAHPAAQSAGHELDRTLVRRRERFVDVEPRIRVSRHGRIEDALRRQSKSIQLQCLLLLRCPSNEREGREKPDEYPSTPHRVTPRIRSRTSARIG